ncbi:hypothetical protein HJ590_16840 [Naumannella sp. ID2617S]|nr:hypothetical protein [Naumannella sp. ID2617S]
MLEVRTPQRVWLAGRDRERLDALCAELADVPCELRPITDEVDVERAVRASQVVLCCTSAPTPLFDGDWVGDGACVVAMGSHFPDQRELDGSLVGRSLVVVEDRATALREAGDVVLGIAEGQLAEDDLRTMAELATGRVPRATDRPNVFKTVGMSWQDVVIAEAAAAGAGLD